MKKFLIKSTLFLLLPALAILIAGVLLPPTIFTFRTYEALSFGTEIPRNGFFYPHQKTFMYAEGDLCHHTSKSILKKELWITDKFGFRNDEFIEKADILLIGDSFFAGTGSSQDEIISNKIKSNSNNEFKVYNMSNCSFSDFDRFLKTGVIKKPKWIVFETSERNTPNPIHPFIKNNLINSINNLICQYDLNVFIDKAFKFTMIRWLRARVNNIKGLNSHSGIDSNMFFNYKGRMQHPEEDLNKTVKTIISYKKYCDSLGINFLFVPMPDKETVYYDLVPLDKQPHYLYQLDSLLHHANVSTLNTLKIYNDHRKKSSELLYHLDDTHWNPIAIELLSKEIIRKITMNAQPGFGENGD